MFLSHYETFPDSDGGKAAAERPRGGLCQQLRLLLRKVCPCWPLDLLLLKR
jgi:hypothetical protein